MSLGERATLRISADFGYGSRSFEEKIPANSDLIFDVELLAIGEKRAASFPVKKTTQEEWDDFYREQELGENLGGYCCNDRCWQRAPCPEHSEGHKFANATYDDDVDDVGDDLSFLTSVLVDQYQSRTVASEAVMNCVDRHFDACNQAKTTKLDEIAECESCAGARFQASCEIPSRNNMPKLSLVSATCTGCKARKVAVTVGETRTVHTPTSIVLQVSSQADLERDVVKSETSRVEIPEVGLELEPGTLGGKYTTVLNLIELIIQDISSSCMLFGGNRAGLNDFLDSLEGLCEAKQPFTLILDDEFGRSFVGGPATGVQVTVRPPTSGGGGSA